MCLVLCGMAVAADVLKKTSDFPSIKPVDRTYYVVQVGSFPTKQMAVKHLENLALKDYSAEIVSAIVNGAVWYRTSVGRFESQPTAQEFQKLLSVHHPDIESFVTKRPSK
jgi:cell division protein FtsN